MKKTLTLLTAAMMLTACDYLDKRGFDKERSGSAYRTAMADYRAGRIKEAIKGLQSVCTSDPANSSARFQLACLLQDYAKDYFAAACAYNEYLSQQPGSDKSALARDRVKECEKRLAETLASKYKLNVASVDQSRQVEALQASLKDALSINEKTKKDLESAMRRVAALVMETDRLKSFLRSEDKSEKRSADVATEIKNAQELLDEGAGNDKQDVGTAEAKALLADEPNEPPPMISQSQDAKTKRDAARNAAKEESRKKAELQAMKGSRPEYYVVQKDDTLYKIAVQFYGTRKAWVKIRDANKAVISTDGRVRAGQRIRLPAE